MNRIMIGVLFFSTFCYAQAVKPKTSLAKSKAVVACEAKAAESAKNADAALKSLEGSLAAALDERDKLKTENSELAKKYDDAMTVLSLLNNHISGKPYTDEQTKKIAQMSGSDALTIGASIESEQGKLINFALKVSEHDSLAVEKYNALLADYKDYVTRVGIQLAQIGQANRVNNALAIYQTLPRYTPPQNVNVNVTDCTKLPALCVH
jgi:hypothetical protein